MYSFPFVCIEKREQLMDIRFSSFDLNFFFCLVLPVGLLATPCLGTAGK
jgi:hypothetical protein